MAAHERAIWADDGARAARERALAIAARDGDERKLAELVEISRPGILRLARRYRFSLGIHEDELVQAGVVGLLQALERFDPAFANPFWAYASWWVRQAMQELVSSLSGPVALSDRALRELAAVRAAWERHVRCHGREPSSAQLAEGSGLGEEKIRRLSEAARPARGIDGTAGPNGSRTIADTVADPVAEDGYERVLLAVATAGLPALLARLDERETLVVRGRFGLDGAERPLSEIASQLGLSNERIRQIEAGALRTMRAAAESQTSAERLLRSA